MHAHKDTYIHTLMHAHMAVCRLEIGDQLSRGLTLARHQLTDLLDTSREAQLRQKHYHKLLMSEASTVPSSPEKLETVTKEEFTKLYSKDLLFKQGFTKSPLTSKEEYRLQVLHDVVPARLVS